MATSIAFQTDKPLSAYGPLAAQVEAYGFPVVTVYNDMLFQPAWFPLMEMARHTSRIRLGPTAVNPFTSHPINIAAYSALLDEASNGRSFLGIARGSWLEFVDIAPEKPITAVKEAFTAVRHLLTQNKAPHEGTIFPLAGGDSFRWQIKNANIPFLLGSWGPKTIKACADQIEEVKLGGSANPTIVQQYQNVVPDHVSLVVGAVTVVDEDGAAAKRVAKKEAALYLSVIAKLDQTLGIEPELMTRIEKATAVYDYDTVAQNISDELLQKLAFAGTPEEVAQQANELFQAGAGRVEFGTPHGLTAENGLTLLGERVLPLIQK
ncbi:MAG: LLM class flavin-dependent oxidoreductase [Chloroflexota bacterium]